MDANADAGEEGLGAPAAGPPNEGAPSPNLEEEREVWRGRTSWKHFSDALALTAGWTVVAVILGFSVPRWLGWLLFGVTLSAWLVIVGCVLHGIWGRSYRLTSQRLFIERGILSRVIDQMELMRVDDVRIYKTLADRVMNAGSVEVFSTDTSDRTVQLIGVPQPEQLADEIRRYMRVLREHSVYVERL